MKDVSPSKDAPALKPPQRTPFGVLDGPIASTLLRLAQ